MGSRDWAFVCWGLGFEVWSDAWGMLGDSWGLWFMVWGFGFVKLPLCFLAAWGLELSENSAQLGPLEPQNTQKIRELRFEEFGLGSRARVVRWQVPGGYKWDYMWDDRGNSLSSLVQHTATCNPPDITYEPSSNSY